MFDRESENKYVFEVDVDGKITDLDKSFNNKGYGKPIPFEIKAKEVDLIIITFSLLFSRYIFAF